METRVLHIKSPVLRLLLVLGILVLVAGLDLATGYELGFFVFYYIPTALAAWLLSLYPATAVAIVSALLWFGIDMISGNVYPNPFVAVWNTFIRLLAFLIIAWGLNYIHSLLVRERQTTTDLRRAIAEITILEGILPICASCKKIRTPENEWQQMERYITDHSKAQFSHGLCPDCARRYMAEAGLTDFSGKSGPPPKDD